MAKILDCVGDPTKFKLENVGGCIDSFINLALYFAGGLAVLFIILGAYQYLTAFGSEEKANKGKSTLTWAIIGLVVMACAKLLVELIKWLIQK